MFEEEGEGDAGQTGAGPHYPVGEAFALDEPLVEVDDAGGVGDGAADGVEHALGDDEVGDGCCEGGHGDAETHDDEAEDGRPAAMGREAPEETHYEGGVEVHDSLDGGEGCVYL